MKTTTTTRHNFLLFLVTLLCDLLYQVKAFASLDTTVRCSRDFVSSDGEKYCVGYVEFYSPSPVLPPYDPDSEETQGPVYAGGWSWIYTFVDGLEEDFDTSQLPYDDLREVYQVGEIVTVRLEDDQVTCSVTVGNLGECQSCTFCELGGWADEKQSATFQADCTNISGGRDIMGCEPTVPFFLPVDFYGPDYETPSQTSVPSQTSIPSQTSVPSQTSSLSQTSVPSPTSSFPSQTSSVPSQTSVPTTSTKGAYNLKSQLYVTLSLNDKEAQDLTVTKMDVDVVLSKLKEFLTQWLRSSNNKLSSATVDLEMTSYDYDTTNHVIQVDFQSQILTNENDVAQLTEREVAELLVRADFGDYITDYLRKSTNNGVLRKTTKVVIKAIGTG